MTTTKRHMYVGGTVNVQSGDVAVKQDINYYSANTQSATRSIIRMMEDMDRRFSQNQIYDGLAVSNGGATVDVASGTAKIGGRWVSVDAEGLSAAVGDDDYNVVLHQSGVSETNSRDPSTGETTNLYLESSGSWVDDDFKLVIGKATISSSTVDSVVDVAKRKINANIIQPHGTSTQVSIYTGTKPVYREAIRFTTTQILPYNDIVSAFDVTAVAITGTTLDISGQSNLTTLDVSGQSNLATVSGTTFGATSYAIGGDVLDTEFPHLVGLDQPVDTTQSPSWVQINSTQTGSVTPPFVVASTALVDNLNARYLSGSSLGMSIGNIPILEGTPADDDYVKLTATGIEGRDYTQVKSDLGLTVGSDVQAYDEMLKDFAALSYATGQRIPYISATGVSSLLVVDVDDITTNDNVSLATTKGILAYVKTIRQLAPIRERYQGSGITETVYRGIPAVNLTSSAGDSANYWWVIPDDWTGQKAKISVRWTNPGNTFGHNFLVTIGSTPVGSALPSSGNIENSNDALNFPSIAGSGYLAEWTYDLDDANLVVGDILSLRLLDEASTTDIYIFGAYLEWAA